MTGGGEMLGRQPAVLYITPSQPNPWYGGITAGKRFTREQELALAHLGINPGDAEAITVKRQATDREYSWPMGQLPPEFHFECPVLHRRPDGRVKVLSPAGFAKIVFDDGWIRRPRKARRFAF